MKSDFIDALGELQREDTFKQKLTRKIQRNSPNKNFIREETNEVNQNEEQSGNEEQGGIEEQSGNEEQGHIEEQSGNEVLSTSSFLDVGCTNIQEYDGNIPMDTPKII